MGGSGGLSHGSMFIFNGELVINIDRDGFTCQYFDRFVMVAVYDRKTVSLNNI